MSVAVIAALAAAAVAATTPDVDRVAKIGAFATYVIGSDSHPVEVVDASKSGHMVTVRAMKSRCTDYERQTYETESNPDGRELVFTRRKGGTDTRPIYMLAGCSYGLLTVGIARHYIDPSF